MSESTEAGYFFERARAERHLAETANDPRAAAAHSELAARYEALASDPNPELPVRRNANG